MWLLMLWGCGSEYRECTGREGAPCYEVPSGRYLVLEPEEPPEQALVYFHSYSSSASDTLEKRWIEEDVLARGLLLVLPDGVARTWSHPGSPDAWRDEIRFLDQILADVSQRWPGVQFHASGFSQGASMAWYAACERGGRFESFFPAGGSFWLDLPEDCPGAPLRLRHSHGLADSTFPLEGRGITSSSTQGNTYEGIARWARWSGCDLAPDREQLVGESRCAVWDDCDPGGEIQLCLHEEGHVAPDDWMKDNLDWALGAAD